MQFDIEEYLENSRVNEEIAKNLFEIETKILSLHTFKDLFEKLLTLLEEKFAIPFVWLSLVKEHELSSGIASVDLSPLLKNRFSLLPSDTLSTLVTNGYKPSLVNQDTERYYALLPKQNKCLFKSLAITPLVIENELVGTLNLGDYSESRFVPQMDTFFLSQLGVKVSICITNIAAHEKLASFATRDSLTGLLNRRELDGAIVKEFSRAIRYGHPLSVVLIECENLKRIKEEEDDHRLGDKVLHTLADHLKTMIRKDDIIFRYGKDTFAVLLPHQGKKYASTAIERLQSFLSAHPLDWNEKPVLLTISAGISSTEEEKIGSAELLLARADENLSTEKRKKSWRHRTKKKSAVILQKQ